MSRTKLSGLNTRTDRLPLKPRNSPYWLVMEKGRALGYRKGTNGGIGSHGFTILARRGSSSR